MVKIQGCILHQITLHLQLEAVRLELKEGIMVILVPPPPPPPPPP